MKKLIMFIAVAALAVAGYSAEVTWGAGNGWIKDKNGNNLAKDTEVMLIMASDASAVSSALAAGNSISSYVLDTAKTSNTKGLVAQHEVSNATKFTAGNSYDLALLILNGDDYMISGAMSFSAYTAGVDEAAGKSFTNTQGNNPTSAWGPKSGSGGGDIPEPTSALLLLMGGAMLALRRKQK